MNRRRPNTFFGVAGRIIKVISLFFLLIAPLSKDVGARPNQAQEAFKELCTTVELSTSVSPQDVDLSELKKEANYAIGLSQSRAKIQGMKCLFNAKWSPAISEKMRSFLEAKYSDLDSLMSKDWIAALIKEWESDDASVGVITWDIFVDDKSYSLTSVAVFGADAKVLYDDKLADIPVNVEEQAIPENNQEQKRMSQLSINPTDTDSSYYYKRVSSLFGSVTLNYQVDASAEVAPYISPITNDGIFNVIPIKVMCWKSNPSGIPPLGVPVVFFGTGGAVGNKNAPYNSPIRITGSVDHFHTGTYDVKLADGLGSSWTVSFSVSYVVGIGISPPSDNTTPVVLQAPNTTGRQINIADMVYYDFWAGKYRGTFWNTGYLYCQNFIVRAGEGGSEKGTITTELPIQCAYHWWDIVPQIQYEGYAGELYLSVEYVRGHMIPSPNCTMIGSQYDINESQQTTVTVAVQNPSTVVSMGPGEVVLDISSLGNILKVIGSASQSLGTIQPGASGTYTFTLEGKNPGSARPQALVSGQWGWPAGDAGKTFSRTATLDKDINVKPQGDANGDGNVTVADIVYLVSYLFKHGPAPASIQSGDANCDGKVTIADIVYLVSYLFKGGPPPGC
ncbi:MAG: dockerin type I repeat-containing protein [candidate division Zixibacteria bacterium]|nr:dockerin type I repeat-containing protein [candidate division Zixibacteria bacterium]